MVMGKHYRDRQHASRTRLLVAVIVAGLGASLLLDILGSAHVRDLRVAKATTTATARQSEADAAAQRERLLALRVDGNRLRDASGAVVTLRGVNRDGTDFLCVGGRAIFDGPTGPASIAALRSWRINAVRLPLNESCWLGGAELPAATTGAAYRDAIAGYVAALHAAGLYVVLDLHKVSEDGAPNTHTFAPMPDAKRAPAFWSSVAARFGHDGMTLLDLYNEPHDVSWACWRDGGAACAGMTPYPAVGMAALVAATRAAGARNVILLSGVSWANDLTGWLAYAPHDPLGNLAASWHVYTIDIGCASAACYDRDAGAVAAAVPLIVTEFGNDVYGHTCGLDGVDGLLTWLDARGASYLAWDWNVGAQTCASLALIQDWSGTPKAPNGTFYHDHLLGVAG